MTEPVPVDDLVPCKVCSGVGVVLGDEWGNLIDCPCMFRRPCDPLCRCSGGPL